MSDYNYQPLDLAGIIAHGWRLTLRTAASAGVIGLAALLPIGMAMDHFAKQFYTAMASVIDRHGLPGVDESNAELFVQEFLPMAGTVTLYYLLILLYLIGIIYVQSLTTSLSWEAIGGGRPTLWEGLRGSFGRAFRRNLLQSVLLGIFVIMAMVAQRVLRDFAGIVAPMFEAIVLVIVFGAFAYIGVATSFRVHEIIVDGRGPWNGLVSSMALTSRNWWRVAALMSIIVVIAIILAGVLPGLASPGDLFNNMSITSTPASQDAEALAAMMSDYARSFTLGSSLIQRTMLPLVLHFAINLLTATYVDLRVRRGDFEESGE